MNQPDTPRDQLITEERDAERAVLEAESAALFAQSSGDATAIAGTAERLQETRLASLHVRQRMQEGLDAWTRYASYQEALAHAEANGLPVPAVT